MRSAPLIVMLLLAMAGCAADSRAAREQVLRKVQAQPDDAPMAAIEPMLGSWVADADATVRENSMLSNNFLAFVREDLEQFPVELLITRHDYISRTSVKTVEDRYTVVKVAGDVVQIKLQSQHIENSERIMGLRIKDGLLLINNGSIFIAVFRRPTSNQ